MLGFNPISGRKGRATDGTTPKRWYWLSFNPISGKKGRATDYEAIEMFRQSGFNPISGKKGRATLTIFSPHKHWVCGVCFRDDLKWGKKSYITWNQLVIALP